MLMGVTVGIEALRLRWSRSVTTDGATVPNGIYRKRMIARVTNAWIEGALYRSLDAVARAERQSPSQHRPTRPWNLVLALSGQLPQQDPPDLPVIYVFQKVEGALLVVGDPGAGKTTLLLELLRDLLVLSSSDSRYPVPVAGPGLPR
jgi:Cdc6-like AAA superfamily ATPase